MTPLSLLPGRTVESETNHSARKIMYKQNSPRPTCLRNKQHLTHLNRVNFPISIGRTSLGCWVVFYIFIRILIVHSVSKQRRPWSDAAFCGVWSGYFRCLPMSQKKDSKPILVRELTAHKTWKYVLLYEWSPDVAAIIFRERFQNDCEHFNPSLNGYFGKQCRPPRWNAAYYIKQHFIRVYNVRSSMNLQYVTTHYIQLTILTLWKSPLFCSFFFFTKSKKDIDRKNKMLGSARWRKTPMFHIYSRRAPGLSLNLHICPTCVCEQQMH